MSIPDAVVLHYYTLTTPLSPADLKKVVVRLQSGGSAPRDVKAELAEMVVSMYHGPESGRSARAEFDRVFREGGLPDEIPEVRVPAAPQGIWIVQLLAETSLVPSRGEARRMVRQGAVSVDGEVITTEEAVVPLEAGTSRLIRVGKRRFLRIVPDGGNRGA
jgi:tyrosyl-tRNA synthetase